MADTLDGDELEAVVLLGVAGNLAIGEPWSVGIDNRPVELLDPLLGAVGGDGTIGIAGVEHEVGLALKDLVDPHGGLVLDVISEGLRAHLPGLNFSGDVESLTHVLSVEIVSEEITVDGCRSLGLGNMGDERSVFSHGHTALVSAGLSLDDGGAEAGGVGGREVVVLSVKIVPVKLSAEVRDLLGKLDTLRGLGGGAHVVEVSSAASILNVLKHAHGDNLHVGKGGRERGPHIVAPVGGSVTDHGAAETDLGKVSVELGLEVVLVDLPGHVGNIDSSVRLTRDEDIVGEVLREFLEPVTKGLDGILGLDHVVGVEVVVLSSGGPADAGG